VYLLLFPPGHYLYCFLPFPMDCTVFFPRGLDLRLFVEPGQSSLLLSVHENAKSSLFLRMKVDPPFEVPSLDSDHTVKKKGECSLL